MKEVILVVLAIVIVLVLFKFLFKVALLVIGVAAVIYLVQYFSRQNQKQLPK